MFSAMRLLSVNQAISTWFNAIHSKFDKKLDFKFNRKSGYKFENLGSRKNVFNIISYSLYPTLPWLNIRMVEITSRDGFFLQISFSLFLQEGKSIFRSFWLLYKIKFWRSSVQTHIVLTPV